MSSKEVNDAIIRVPDYQQIVIVPEGEKKALFPPRLVSLLGRAAFALSLLLYLYAPLVDYMHATLILGLNTVLTGFGLFTMGEEAESEESRHTESFWIN